jgi:CBS domain-containing protein
MLIKDFMTKNVKTLSEKGTLAQAREMMTSQRIRQIPVVNDEVYLQGIISKRDIYAASVSNLTANHERSKSLIESRLMLTEVMTKDVQTAAPSDQLSSAALRLQELRVGALPIVEDGKLVGIISSSDFLGIAVMLLDK